MTIRAYPNRGLSNVSGPATLNYALYYWMKWMKTASPVGPGWTIPRSSDGAGTVEGVNWGAGDFIDSAAETDNYSASTRRSWWIMRAPDGSRDILFVKSTTSAAQYTLYASPSGAFTGGDAWNTPSAPDSMIISNWGPSTTSYTGMMHYVADDAPPYGFWMYIHLAGAPATHYWSIAQGSCDVFAVPGDTSPIITWVAVTSVAWTTSYLSTQGGSGYEWRGLRPVSPSNQVIMALYTSSAQGMVMPDGVESLSSGEDFSFPVSFGRNASLGAGYFKGVSSFFQWNGRARAVGELFENKTRVSLGQMNVPWDGVSAFLLS